jgi:serine/threonine-protein kinase
MLLLLMSNGAQPASSVVAYRVLRELGARAQRAFAAIREPHELVVLHRFARKGGCASAPEATVVSSEQLSILLRDAQCLSKNWHPNIARVKHVELVDGDLWIATELVDGATLGDLLALTSARGISFPLDVLVRVLLDVLAGVHGIHGLRDGQNMSLGAIHGEVCPANVVVGRDGVARIVNALRPRPVRIAAGSEAVGHAAPETLDGGTPDARADVYAVGVILWEALTGKALHDEKEPARVLTRQREIDIVRPKLPQDSPYGALVDIAMRALSFEPSLRFRTAAELAAELRRLPTARIATGSVVAARVNELDGERIRGRRAALDRTASGTRPRLTPHALEAARGKSAGQEERVHVAPRKNEDRATMVPASVEPATLSSSRLAALPDEPSSVDLVEDHSPSRPMVAAASSSRDRAKGAPAAPRRPPPIRPRTAPTAMPQVAPAVSPPAPPSRREATPEASPLEASPLPTLPNPPAIAPVAPRPASPADLPESDAPLHIDVAELVEEPPLATHEPSFQVDVSRSPSSVAIEEAFPAKRTDEKLALAASSGLNASVDIPGADEGFDVERLSRRKRRVLAVAALVLLVVVGVLVVGIRTSTSDRVATQRTATRHANSVVSTARPIDSITSTPSTPLTSSSGPAPTAMSNATVTSEAPPAAEQRGPAAAPVVPAAASTSTSDAIPKSAPRSQPTRRYEPLGI